MSAQYRLDKLQFSSLLPNRTNVRNSSDTITVSGTLANDTTQNYATTVPLSSSTNFIDVYAYNDSFKVKLVSSATISDIFDYKSDEFVQNSVVMSDTSVTVTITVNNNTGASVTLNSQVFTIEAVEYVLPL